MKEAGRNPRSKEKTAAKGKTPSNTAIEPMRNKRRHITPAMQVMMVINEGNTGHSVIMAPSPSLNSARRSAIVSLVLALALAAVLGIA